MTEKKLLRLIAKAAKDGVDYFSLSNVGLKELPPEIGKLGNLTELYVFGNQLTTLPPEIAKLGKLHVLDLGFNQLTELPPEIAKLGDLIWLRVAGNQLTTLPPEIAKLANLTALYLYDNQLTTLPPELARLAKLQFLYLDGNPLTDPPPWVVGQGTEAVLAYLRGRLEESRTLWVSKLLLVGEGGVGKTCLLGALLGEAFDPQSETTHGIDVQPLKLRHPTEQDVTMTLNCWDFGGQQIYHATHQFFLTNRSLYVLVWNARVGFEQCKLYDWLDRIKVLAPDSPILLVATHIDERDADLPFEDLRRKYPKIVEPCEISSKDGRGVEKLRDAIAKAAVDLPLMGKQWPATWLDAAEAIRQLKPKRDRITAVELQGIMDKHGVASDSHGVLGGWLHELGDILHFDGDAELKDTVLLNSEWVTRNISHVLECKEIIDGLGIFRREHMDLVGNRRVKGAHAGC